MSLNFPSISFLIKTRNCKLIFSSIGSYTRDSQNNVTIGSANQVAGLYFYEHVNTHDRKIPLISLNNCNSMNINLWHSRL